VGRRKRPASQIIHNIHRHSTGAFAPPLRYLLVLKPLSAARCAVIDDSFTSLPLRHWPTL